jgi:hypothetical protein
MPDASESEIEAAAPATLIHERIAGLPDGATPPLSVHGGTAVCMTVLAGFADHIGQRRT